MEKISKTLSMLVFDIVETIVIVLIGKLLNLDIKSIILITFIFVISRNLFGKALHFNSWYKCLVWSSFIALTLFMLFKVDLIISMTFSTFASFVMTGKANIGDVYLWNNNGETSKYNDIMEFIKCNQYNTELIEFENMLEHISSTEYLVYKYRFKENKTFNEISNLLDMDNPRIVERLDRVALAIRIYCNI